MSTLKTTIEHIALMPDCNQTVNAAGIGCTASPATRTPNHEITSDMNTCPQCGQREHDLVPETARPSDLICELEAALTHTASALTMCSGRSDSTPLIIRRAKMEIERAIERERSRSQETHE